MIPNILLFTKGTQQRATLIFTASSEALWVPLLHIRV